MSRSRVTVPRSRSNSLRETVAPLGLRAGDTVVTCAGVPLAGGLRDASPQDWETFTAWLEADPAHAAAYDIVALADVARFISQVGGADLAPSRRDAALVLAGLVAALSERRPSPGSAERAAE